MDLELYINDVEYRVTTRYSIKEQIGQVSTSTFDVQLQENDVPLTHSKVELKYNEEVFYNGLISSVNSPTYSTTYETDIYPITVVSLETIFTRRLASNAFSEKYTHEIVQQLYDEYLIEENITLGNIEEFDRKYKAYTLNNLSLQQAFQELGDEVGGVAYIGADKTFNFVSKSSFQLVDPPEKITKLKKSENGQDLKTVQYISGAKEETSFQSVVTTWATYQKNISLGYQIASAPSVTLNSASVEVGRIGEDEDSTTAVFLYQVNNNSLVLNTNATTQPVAGDIISVIFKGFYDILITTTNESLKEELALISGTSGKIESAVVDTSIQSVADGEETAQNLLDEKSIREKIVTFECKDIENTSLLNTIYLDYPNLNITGNYVIVERQIVDFYEEFKVTLKLKNRSFYSRYGTIYNKGIKEINNLSVRADDVITKTSVVPETVDLEDEIEMNQMLMEFTCGVGDIFAPVYFAGLTPSGISL